MADYFDGQPFALIPHVKIHKTPEIALQQIQAVSLGITCAKVGEIEVIAIAGIDDILIAN